MCPACLASLALWSFGATSTGGVGWLLVKRLRFANSSSNGFANGLANNSAECGNIVTELMKTEWVKSQSADKKSLSVDPTRLA